MRKRNIKIKAKDKKTELLIKRRKAIDLYCNSGYTLEDIAELFEVVPSTVSRWIRDYKELLHNESLEDLKKVIQTKYRQLEDLRIHALEKDNLQESRQAILAQIKLLRLDEIGLDDNSLFENTEYLELSENEIAVLEKFYQEVREE